MSRIRKDTEAPDWVTEDERPRLDAYQERPDFRASFRACEHVAIAQREACGPCAEKIAECRRMFKTFGHRIAIRVVTL